MNKLKPSDKIISYDLHDGKELDLMLSGQKPLSLFYDNPDNSLKRSVSAEEIFDRYVDSGVFTKGELTLSGSIDPRTGRDAKIRFIIYAAKGDEWRIPAMILVLQTMQCTTIKPDEGLNRLIGSLLGYTDDQNNEYISKGRYQRDQDC